MTKGRCGQIEDSGVFCVECHGELIWEPCCHCEDGTLLYALPDGGEVTAACVYCDGAEGVAWCPRDHEVLLVERWAMADSGGS